MTQFVLKVSSWAGVVPGAKHYRGRVTEEGTYGRIQPTGTSLTYSGGKWFDVQADGTRKELPGHIEWDVEARWTEGQYARWANKSFDGDGPSAFLDKKELIDCAVLRFLGDYDREWWEEEVPKPEEGDELWYGWVSPGHEYDDLADDDGWGTCIARRCTT